MGVQSSGEGSCRRVGQPAGGMVRVVVWTAPRCVSTALEKALAGAPPRVDVMHEPLSKHYYFGPQRVSERYAGQPPDTASDATPDGVFERILAAGDGERGAHVVVKDMAYYLDGYDVRAAVRCLRAGDVRHAFLVRSPRATVPSLYKASLDTERTGWDYFDAREVGMESLSKLYDAVVEEEASEPVVLDSDDLIDDPTGAMRAFCGAVGLPFDATRMLAWEEGPLPGWDTWGGWHDDAIHSTGFRPRAERGAWLRECKPTGLGVAHDAVAREAAEAAMPAFQKLHVKRLRW